MIIFRHMHLHTDSSHVAPLSRCIFVAPESQNLPKQPPLMLALGQATECVQLMARVRSGSCSFARIDNFLH